MGVDSIESMYSPSQKFESWGAGRSLREMCRQDVNNVLTNIIKEKSKLRKPRAGKFEVG